jgi:hypothetical protein
MLAASLQRIYPHLSRGSERDCRRQASLGFRDWRRLCLHAGPFHHFRFSAPFRLFDELGHSAGVLLGVRSESQRYINSGPSNSESVLSAQTSPPAVIHHCTCFP